MESQLPTTVKGIIDTLAVKMINPTSYVQKMESCFVEWHEASTENPFISKCAKVVHCPLSHSAHSLAEDIEILRLKGELDDFIKLFAVNSSHTIKQMAIQEVEYAQEQKTKLFANLSVKLFGYLTLHLIVNEIIGDS